MAGIDGYTKLMLHCNGTDASTTFTDSSSSGHTMTANGDAQIDTAQSVFGGASGLFDGNDYVSASDSDDFYFGTDDFTIDFRVRWNGTPGETGFIGQSNGGGSQPKWGFYWNVSGLSATNKLYFLDQNGSNSVTATTTWLPSADTWYHVAIVRNGNNWYFFVDGTQIGTTVSNSHTVQQVSSELRVGSDGEDYKYLTGWLDEVRISKGIARWTSNFTPPTEAYSGALETDWNDTLNLADDWTIQTTPIFTEFNETVILDDNWILQSNPQQTSFDNTVNVSDSWTITLSEIINQASKVIYHNPLILVTDTNPARLYTINITDPNNPIWTGYTLIGASYAKDVIYNSTTGYYYVACANGIVVKVDKNNPSTQTIINLSDTDNLLTIDALNEFYLTFASTENADGEIYQIDERTSQTLNTNFYYNIAYFAPIDTNINWIEAKTLDTNFQYLTKLNETLKTDFKWLPAVDTFSPIGREDIVVKVNGSSLTEGDLIMDSIIVTHTIDSESMAVFALARNHDNINQTLAGGGSVLTNQNAVIVTIKGRTEFTGKVANIDCKYEKNTEYILVTAKSTQTVTSSKNITVSLPSKDKDISIYDVLVQNPVIYNPYIDPTIDTETDAPEFYKGIKVNMGQKITQQQYRGRAIEWAYGLEQGENAEKIEDGTFEFKNDMTYFWLVSVLNYISPVAWAGSEYKYIGTSLGAVSADTWYLKGVTYYMQRLFDDKVEELGYYEVGEAPFKEISVKNGQFITNKRYEDKPDGLYTVKEESYNYVGNVQDYDHDGQFTTIAKGYTQRVADLEYEKLQNINGTILPKTTVAMQLSFDAYQYYNMKLLNRINVDNTTATRIFNNNNGFPVSIKTITINSKSMRVALRTDNTKSKSEMEEIDARYPNEEDYIQEAYSGLMFTKYTLPSARPKMTSEEEEGYNDEGYHFLPFSFWKDE